MSPEHLLLRRVPVEAAAGRHLEVRELRRGVE